MEIGPIISPLRGLPESVALRPGERLNVNILEVFENQRVLVSLGGFRTMATVTFPVAAGDELQVQVEAAHGQLQLRLVPTGAGPGAPGARAVGPAAASAAECFKQLQEQIDQLARATAHGPVLAQLPAEPRLIAEALRLFIEPLDPGSNPATLAGKLQEWCEESGLFLEQRLADVVRKGSDRAGAAGAADAAAGDPAGRILSTDLKARLLSLKAFFESADGRQWVQDSREAAGLARAALELLAGVRAGQAQIGPPSTAADAFQMVHFPLPLPDERGRGELKIAYRRKPAAGKQEAHRAAILLQLDRIGAVRADLALLGSSLEVSIFVGSAAVQDLIRRRVSEVHAALAPFFARVAVQVSVSSSKIAQFASEDWRPALETRVDVRV